MGSPIYAPTEWRFTVLGPSMSGWKKLTILTNLADDVELLYQLNRSTMLTFSVPSDYPQVNILHTDGLPFIAVGPRWVLGWRKSPATLDPTPGGWELKFAGRIWSLEDQGDGTTTRTLVTCFDPLKHLEKRVIRGNEASGYQFRNQVKWWATPGQTIIKEMIDRTQTHVGTCRIDTAGGTWLTCADTTYQADQKYVMPGLLDITNTGLVDLDPAPLDGTEGDFLQLGAKPRLGSDKPNVVLGYARAPRRSVSFDRTVTLDNLANYVAMFGKSNKGFFHEESDAPSQATYDIFEDVSILSDIETNEFVTLLAQEEIFLRKSPYDLVTITPTPEDSPRFFNEYFIGDTITLRAGKQPFPDTRETVDGIQRVYGVTLTIDSTYGEHVTEMIASAQAESS